MLAVPFLVMVASTRKGRLVMLTVLCVMVSAIRSSFHSDDSFISLGRHDWHEGFPPVVREDQEKQSRFMRRVIQLLRFRASEPAILLEDWRSHLTSTVSAEEIVMHLRQEAGHASWLDKFRSPFLRRRSKNSDGTGAYVVEGQFELSILASNGMAAAAASQEVTLQSLVEPLMLRDVWNSLTGEEFKNHPELLEPLAKMGEQVARGGDTDPWIEWKPYGKGNEDDEDTLAVHVWTGRARDAKNYHGSDVPFVKTRSRIPLSPTELKDLLLDSSRIKTYNPWSTGRKDCWIATTAQKKSKNTEHGGIETKIVKNKTKPPVGSALVGVTLLHSRPLANGGWIVVSRAVGGNAYFEADDIATAGRSDILLGINLIEPIAGDEESSFLTAVTQAYSSAIPSVLAERLGVKSAVKFVQDMRKLKVPA